MGRNGLADFGRTLSQLRSDPVKRILTAVLTLSTILEAGELPNICVEYSQDLNPELALSHVTLASTIARHQILSKRNVSARFSWFKQAAYFCSYLTRSVCLSSCHSFVFLRNHSDAEMTGVS